MNNDDAQQTTPPQTLTVVQIADHMGLTARELQSLRLRGLGPEILQRGLSQIRSTLGVSQLLHFGSRPAKVDDGLIDHLHQREQALPTEALFHAGDSVIIAERPFAGIEAIYQTREAEQRALILLQFLHRSRYRCRSMSGSCARRGEAVLIYPFKSSSRLWAVKRLSTH